VRDRTRWVAFLVNAFQGVKNVSIVVDHIFDQASEETAYDPCVLIDPIDVKNTILNYQQFDPCNALSLALPEPEEIETDEVEVDAAEVIEELADTFWEGEEEDLPQAPRIEYKVAISEGYAYKLRSSMAECRARIEEYFEEEVETFEEY
jgi:hypothetical protein